MRTQFFLLLLVSLIFICNSSAQIVGRLVDENGDGLYEVTVDVHLGNDIYSSTTDIDGNFTISTTTSVEDEILPEGYTVSDNYPNPFNPKTRFNISVPQKSNVEIRIYNLLGQEVADRISKVFDTGINSVDLELNGLANGIYLARISIDHKYSVTKKLMLIYGSQHLNSAGTSITNFGKSNLGIQNRTETPIDSLVVHSTIIGRKVFTQLPIYNGELLDLGNLEIARYCPDAPTVTYEGKVYNTVQIGSQCWLRENLDVGTMIESDTSGFLQTDNGTIEKYCYNNDPANCETYGGLYEWHEAMQYVTQEGAQGICPEGWHILTFVEFETLRDAVGGDGNALKAFGQGSGYGGGTNTSGFSALLAGHRYKDSTFLYIGSLANFWSSTEYSTESTYGLGLDAINNGLFIITANKENGFSVRCIKGQGANSPPNNPSNPSPSDSATGVSTTTAISWNCNDPDGDTLTYDVYFGTSSNPPLYQSSISATNINPSTLNENTTYYWKIVAKDNNGGVTEGSVWSFTTEGGGSMGIPCPDIPTVTYAGKSYNTVLIGDQCWLKENLDVGTMIISDTSGFLQSDNGVIEKYCYDNDPANCETYGGLYEWPEAMQYTTQQGTQGICPEGWHIPTSEEFQTLMTYVNYQAAALIDESETLNYPPTVTQNETGFSALFAGYRTGFGYFHNLGNHTSFLSSSKYNSSDAISMRLHYNSSDVSWGLSNNEQGFSVRCVKD